ncbi:hypothetical protein CW354_01340 [Marinicaulis flavus]|uniref:HTH marR-type domain-containing protein n=1 Tax=Hyphococcus luteus TaxID=2058213 RepID=A0A2S7KAJ7_9PROT|nr:hypothetical protein CW354_01340 [Marinicaulis flavus]
MPSRKDFPHPDLRLTISIVRTGRIWRSIVDEHLRQLGHSASRMEVMATIYFSPPFTTQIQIAKRVGIEGPTLTRTLDMLEADGLVERLPDPSDRRNKHLRVTEKGVDALNDIMEIAEKLRARLLADMSAEDVNVANKLLSLMQERLDEGLPPLEGEE